MAATWSSWSLIWLEYAVVDSEIEGSGFSTPEKLVTHSFRTLLRTFVLRTEATIQLFLHRGARQSFASIEMADRSDGSQNQKSDKCRALDARL